MTLSMWRMGMAAIFSSRVALPWRRRPKISVNWSTNSCLREHRILRARKDAQTLAEQLQGVPCHFVRKAGEEGKLFGSVTSMDIAEALKGAGFEVDRRYIQLDQPIKSVGDFTVPVRLPAETSALLKVTVAAE